MAQSGIPFYLIYLYKLSDMKKTLLLSTLVILLNSCSEVRRGGCIDPYAYNYESFADFDDGSCVYTADVVFFYDAITANELNLVGFDRLDYYIEETPGTFISVGQELPTPSFIYAGIPICYEQTYITTPIEWYNTDNTIINYLVYGITYVNILGTITEVETLVDEYSFELYANECAGVPIRFLTKSKKE